jgi:hypothetical protein
MDNEFIELMKRSGIPVTRQNYIDAAWGNELPEWDAELEAQLPPDLQDWSLFEMRNGELVLKK